MTASSEWISVGALGAAFEPEADLLPEVQSLGGRTLLLHLEEGSRCALEFLDDHQLRWDPREAGQNARLPNHKMTVAYRATEIRPNIICVNFIRPDARAATATIILELSRAICTVVLGNLPNRSEATESLLDKIARGAELTNVHATFLSGSVDVPFTALTARHPPTRELLGKRVEYTYSPTERYEHIYLNDRFYSWHCLAGSECGLADTDRCHYLKLATDLYLFVWREKIVPTLGIVVVDLAQLKTTGQIFGYRDFDFGALTNFPVGARARVINVI